jgi:hypothetical protein
VSRSPAAYAHAGVSWRLSGRSAPAEPRATVWRARRVAGELRASPPRRDPPRVGAGRWLTRTRPPCPTTRALCCRCGARLQAPLLSSRPPAGARWPSCPRTSASLAPFPKQSLDDARTFTGVWWVASERALVRRSLCGADDAGTLQACEPAGGLDAAGRHRLKACDGDPAIHDQHRLATPHAVYQRTELILRFGDGCDHKARIARSCRPGNPCRRARPPAMVER